MLVLSPCRHACLCISQKLFRARAVILWFFLLGFVISISIFSVILSDGNSERNGISLRNVPYGRSRNKFNMVNHKYPDYAMRKIKLENLHAFDDVLAKHDDKTYGKTNDNLNKLLPKSVTKQLPPDKEVHDNDTKELQMNPSLQIPKGKILHKHGNVKLSQIDIHKLNASYLGCEEIASLNLKRRVGRGTTKDVYVSNYQNTEVAVKMVSPKVADIKACLRRKMYRDKEECFVYANYKIMKEITLAQQLQHPGIIKLIGFCIQSSPLFNEQTDHGVISVVEFGAKSSLHRLTSLDWNQRLEAAILLADLLDYLENSPLGSLCIWDYKHSQFVLTADNKIKYSDLDDLSGDEPECTTEDDCVIPDSNRIRVECSHSRCHGFNAKFNLQRTLKEFFRPILRNPKQTDENNSELDELFTKIKSLEINAKDVKQVLLEMKSKHIMQGFS